MVEEGRLMTLHTTEPTATSSITVNSGGGLFLVSVGASDTWDFGTGVITLNGDGVAGDDIRGAARDALPQWRRYCSPHPA